MPEIAQRFARRTEEQRQSDINAYIKRQEDLRKQHEKEMGLPGDEEEEYYSDEDEEEYEDEDGEYEEGDEEYDEEGCVMCSG